MKQEMLALLEEQIQILDEEKKRLTKIFWHLNAFPEEELGPLIDFIEAHPGCNKQEIRDYLMVPDEELNRLLMKARRNWGLIENLGTRHQSKWYKVS